MHYLSCLILHYLLSQAGCAETTCIVTDLLRTGLLRTVTLKARRSMQMPEFSLWGQRRCGSMKARWAYSRFSSVQ